jgi:phosphoribosylanthranilate isomerase
MEKPNQKVLSTGEDLGEALTIKVCGMKNPENISAITALPIDYIGFIFYEKSQRYVSEKINISIPEDIKKVGVFVNEKIEVILSKVIDYQLAAVQLHGNETNDFIKNLRSHLPKTLIFKAIPIAEVADFEKINDYPEADYLLLDTKTPQHGGSGQKFDWSLLENIEFPKPFFLSGGISENDVEAIKQLKINNLYGIDLNSKFEIEPALKDVEKLERFIKSLQFQNETLTISK